MKKAYIILYDVGKRRKLGNLLGIFDLSLPKNESLRLYVNKHYQENSISSKEIANTFLLFIRNLSYLQLKTSSLS